MNKLITKSAPAYKVEIFMGCDDFDLAKTICLEYCTVVGLCVTIAPTTYIYRKGSCEGIVVGLINYARFPAEQEQIWMKAKNLADQLKQFLRQGSLTIQDHLVSVFHSTRDEDQ